LDIQRIISQSLGYKDFIRAFLTKPQKVILAHQRSRIAESDVSQSDESNSGKLLDPVVLENALSSLDLQNQFDRNLLIGVLAKKGTLKTSER